MESASTINHRATEIGLLTGRCLRHAFRSMDTVITVIAMPVMMMLLFVYIFGGAIKTASSSYINYMLPGILIIAVCNGIAYTALRLNNDITEGIFERFHSMPIARSSLPWGHVLTSVASCAVSISVVILIAVLMGFRASAGISGWLLALGVLLLFTVAMTWVAVISGLAAKSAEGASAFIYPLLFLPFVSSAFVPTDSLPGAVRAFAEHQPVTHMVETIRSLFMAEPVGNNCRISILWCVGILAISMIIALRLYKHRIS